MFTITLFWLFCYKKLMANGVTVQKYILYFVKDSSSPLSFLLVAEFNSKGCKKLSSFSPLILEALSKSLCDIVVYNKKYIFGVCWWSSRLRIQQCHCCGSGCCCGAGSIPGLGTLSCQGYNWKKKKKKKEYNTFICWSFLKLLVFPVMREIKVPFVILMRWLLGNIKGWGWLLGELTQWLLA